MALAVDIASLVLISAGAFFILVGAIGIIRLPDFFTRIHAAGVTDTLGAELVLLGLILQAGFSFLAVKLFLVGAFIFFTSPTATHAIANAAYTAGMRSKFADSRIDSAILAERDSLDPEKSPAGKGDRSS